MNEVETAMLDLKRAGSPIEQKVCVMRLARAVVSHIGPDADDGESVQTFEDAGLASGDDGILITSDRLGMELKLTILPSAKFRVKTELTALREGSEPFVPILQMVIKLAFIELGFGVKANG